jgi:hypothetical protein
MTAQDLELEVAGAALQGGRCCSVSKPRYGGADAERL